MTAEFIAGRAVLLIQVASLLRIGQPSPSRPGEEAAHPLGSDLLGRDILRGIVHGARVSLLIGLSATVAALGIGVTVGACAGYFRGWVDDALMRVTELFQTIPNFLLAIVLVALFRASLATIVLAISAVSWLRQPRARRYHGRALRPLFPSGTMPPGPRPTKRRP